MNAPDAERYRRAVMNQRGPIRVGRLARLHKLLRDQRLMANEQAQANAPDPDALADELHAKIRQACAHAAAPAGAQAAIIDWGSLVPTAAELAELDGLSKEALAFVVRYAQNHVWGLIGMGSGGIRPV